ncbi:MAG: hypothetical protein QHI48_04130 [Bacteroidota bacterium]|nr:hypothetical protein [Bacteroidota bacterium]
MFCFQCRHTTMDSGCTVDGALGKPETTSDLQNLFVCKGIPVCWGDITGKEHG